jgi:uncharacterized protein YdaT
MPWTKTDHPDAMKNLPEDIRDKAIEIANALIAGKKMKEGVAVATAISRAKQWSAHRNGKNGDDAKHHTKKNGRDGGQERFVILYENELAHKKSKSESISIRKRTGKDSARLSFHPHKN